MIKIGPRSAGAFGISPVAEKTRRAGSEKNSIERFRSLEKTATRSCHPRRGIDTGHVPAVGSGRKTACGLPVSHVT